MDQLDPNIPLAVRPVPQPTAPAEILSNVLKYQETAAARQQFMENQADQQAVEATLQKNQGDPDATISELNRTGQARAAMKYGSVVASGRKQIADTFKVQLENDKATNELIGGVARTITDEPSFQAASKWATAKYGPQAASILGTSYDPARIAKINDGIMSAKDYNEAQLKALEQAPKTEAEWDKNFANVARFAKTPQQWNDTMQGMTMLGAKNLKQKFGEFSDDTGQPGAAPTEPAGPKRASDFLISPESGVKNENALLRIQVTAAERAQAIAEQAKRDADTATFRAGTLANSGRRTDEQIRKDQADEQAKRDAASKESAVAARARETKRVAAEKWRADELAKMGKEITTQGWRIDKGPLNPNGDPYKLTPEGDTFRAREQARINEGYRAMLPGGALDEDETPDSGAAAVQSLRPSTLPPQPVGGGAPLPTPDEINTAAAAGGVGTPRPQAPSPTPAPMSQSVSPADMSPAPRSGAVRTMETRGPQPVPGPGAVRTQETRGVQPTPEPDYVKPQQAPTPDMARIAAARASLKDQGEGTYSSEDGTFWAKDAKGNVTQALPPPVSPKIRKALDDGKKPGEYVLTIDGKDTRWKVYPNGTMMQIK